jgi:hypothetical protein
MERDFSGCQLELRIVQLRISDCGLQINRKGAKDAKNNSTQIDADYL